MKPQTISTAFAAFAALALAALPAEAHVIATGPGGFAQGLAHPLGGLDHVLAMVGVGLWAAHLGGRARWLVPASFVAAMGLAGGLAMAGVALPLAETAVALTVIALGVLLFARVRVPVAVGMAVAGCLALFHGHVHGIEAPAAAGIAYGVGFMAATAVLHGIGLAAGAVAIGRRGGLPRLAARLGGAIAVVAGVAFLIV